MFSRSGYVLIETYWNVKVLSAGGSGALYSEVGKIFLPSGLLTFFIVGGPLFGVLTSMVPVIMLTCAQIQAAASDLFHSAAPWSLQSAEATKKTRECPTTQSG